MIDFSRLAAANQKNLSHIGFFMNPLVNGLNYVGLFESLSYFIVTSKFGEPPGIYIRSEVVFHPEPYTLHLIPYTLYLIPYTLHPESNHQPNNQNHQPPHQYPWI